MEINEQQKRKKKIMTIGLIIAGGIFLFIGLLPIYPMISWYLTGPGSDPEFKAVERMARSLDGVSVGRIDEEENENPRIFIPSIGVDMKIVYGETDAKKAFAQGAWLLPGTAEPGDNAGNTVIAAHRYMFTSGPNTFYHLDKLEAGDEILIHWRGQDFSYEVVETKIVQPDDTSILAPSDERILTLFTCHPVYTTKERLVVIAKMKN